jgi:hypothetical protein
MALYAALLYYPAERYWMDPGEAVSSPAYGTFMAAAGAAGVLRGGEALHPAGTATTVTVTGGKDGEVVVTDGPYAEAKEVLGGFFMIEAADLDEAVRWAAQIPRRVAGQGRAAPGGADG